MSVVVRRCPQCGSVQDAPGECGTCHEAHVRFFCPNHTPGRWLVASSCPDCGARLAFDPVAPTPARPQPPPERPPEPLPEPAPERPLPPWLERPTRPDVDRARRRDVRVPAEAPSDYVELPEIPEIPEAVRRGASSFAGCLLRLVIIAIVLFLLVMGGGFLWVMRG